MIIHDMSNNITLLGQYQILSSLGRGSFAEVYLAEDTRLHREVALKVLHPQLLSDPDFVRRFENDAHAAASLDHPRIVTVHDIGQAEGRLYIAMQYCSGGSLADRIKRDGPLSFDDAVKVIEQIADGLDYAHSRGFIHRDIKPSNIFFDAQGNAVLGDFGLVKSAEESVIARSSVGGIVGTPAYIAPEISKDEPATPQTDVYALGCVLYEMLTGDVLFERSNTLATILAHSEPRKFPETWPANIPGDIVDVLTQALAIHATKRYASAGAFANALQVLIEDQKLATVRSSNTGQPVTHPVLSNANDAQTPQRAENLQHNRPSGWVYAVVALVLLAAGVGYLSGNAGRRSASKEDIPTTSPTDRDIEATPNTTYPSVTQTPTNTPTSKPSATIRPTVTNTATPTKTPKHTATATATTTHTPSITPSKTPIPTDTPIPTQPPDNHDTSSELQGRIVFTRNPYGHADEGHEIFVLQIETNILTQLTHNTVVDWDPHWSPDGQRIAFVSFIWDNYDIWTMNADGSDLSRWIGLDAWDDYPAWSHKGLVYVTTGVTDGVYNSEVFFSAVSGHQPGQQITFNTGSDEWPDWSPDGGRIAYSSNRDGNYDIYLSDSEGYAIIRLTNSDAFEEQPVWSPDGEWIAFLRKTGDTNANGSLDRRDDGDFGDVWIVRTDGSDLRQLTHEGVIADPAWSPDGKYVVFARFKDTNGDHKVDLNDGSDLWVVPVQGGATTIMTQGPEQDWAPDWTW